MVLLEFAFSALALLATQSPPPAPAPAPAPPPVQVDPLETEWNAALALKQQGQWSAACAAFEAFHAAHAALPRAVEALLEAGVCCIGQAKAQEVLHRNSEASSAGFRRAGEFVQRALEAQNGAASAPRALYLAGQVALYLDDPSKALAAYDAGVQRIDKQDKYAAKCLERRAACKRQLLDNLGAARDLAGYVQAFPKGDELELVRRALRYVQSLDRPAPDWKPEQWALSDPLPPDVYRGDVVVLCFMASWCEKCAREREYVQSLHKRFDPMGVHFVGVVQPWREHDGKTRHTRESFVSFAATSSYGFPLLLDSGGGPGATAAAYGGESLPDMAVVDRKGRVRWHDHPANLLDSTIEALLIEEDAPAAPPAADGSKPK